MERLRRWALRGTAVVVAVAFVVVVLAFLESTGGHDGWLCEWGIDTDGAGTTTTGCG